MVRKGDQFLTVDEKQVAYLLSINKKTVLVTANGTEFMIDQSLDQLGKELNPQVFFRVNRNAIVRVNSILRSDLFFQHKLKLTLNPPTKEEITVPKDKVARYKEWLGGVV